jgi:hypothetical protein
LAALRHRGWILLFCLTCLPGLARAWWEDAWFDPAFLESHSLAGGSGFILVPSPEVLSGGLTAGGLHRYRAKLGHGFWNFLELGGTIELEGWKLDDAEKNNQVYGRLALLRPSQTGFALAVGADQVGPEDFGLKPIDLGFRKIEYIPKEAFLNDDRYYAMAGLVPSKLPMLYLALGYIGGHHGGSVAGAAGLVVFPGLLGIAEYDGLGSNLGLRALLSTQIKLDLDLIHLQTIDRARPFALVLENNVRFGVSYSETWP